MIKIIIRILIILLAAGLVAGGIYLVANNTPTLDVQGGGGVPDGGPHGGGEGHHFRGEGGGSNSFNLASLLSILLNLGKIAVVTIAVVSIQKTISLIPRNKTLEQQSC